MTTKQQIRAEIERRIHSIENCPFIIGEFGQQEREIGEVMAYKDLLSFLDTLPDEPVTDCNEFEEAKEEYIRKARRTPGHEWMTRDIEDAFIAGAEWMKAKMMEGAVEADVMLTLHDKTGDISLHTGYLPKELGIKYGDKVKIIIVKED